MTVAAGDDDVCDFPDVAMIHAIEPVQPGDPCVPTPPDPRFRAIVPMDGSNQLLHVAELKRVAVPSRSSLRVNLVNTTHDGSFGDVCSQIPVFMEAVPGWNTDPIRGVVHASCTGFTPRAEARDLVGLVLAPKVGTGPDAHQAPLGPPRQARL